MPDSPVWLRRKYVVQQLAARLRPQLEAIVKNNESAPGDTFVPGDFTQVQTHQALVCFPCVHISPALAGLRAGCIVQCLLRHCSE